MRGKVPPVSARWQAAGADRARARWLATNADRARARSPLRSVGRVEMAPRWSCEALWEVHSLLHDM